MLFPEYPNLSIKCDIDSYAIELNVVTPLYPYQDASFKVNILVVSTL